MFTAGRMFGVHILVVVALFFAVTLMGFRKGKSWSWYVILIITTIAMSFDSIAVYMMGQLPVVAVNIIVLLISYLALGISAKDILSKK